MAEVALGDTAEGAKVADKVVLKLNLCRRHLDPIRWGQASMRLLEERGVQEGRGADRRSKESNLKSRFDAIANEVGVAPKTAEKRVAQAKSYEALPARQRKKVDSNSS